LLALFVGDTWTCKCGIRNASSAVDCGGCYHGRPLLPSQNREDEQRKKIHISNGKPLPSQNSEDVVELNDELEDPFSGQ
jgi:hypothetical protein